MFTITQCIQTYGVFWAQWITQSFSWSSVCLSRHDGGSSESFGHSSLLAIAPEALLVQTRCLCVSSHEPPPQLGGRNIHTNYWLRIYWLQATNYDNNKKLDMVVQMVEGSRSLQWTSATRQNTHICDCCILTMAPMLVGPWYRDGTNLFRLLDKKTHVCHGLEGLWNKKDI